MVKTGSSQFVQTNFSLLGPFYHVMGVPCHHWVTHCGIESLVLGSSMFFILRHHLQVFFSKFGQRILPTLCHLPDRWKNVSLHTRCTDSLDVPGSGWTHIHRPSFVWKMLDLIESSSLLIGKPLIGASFLFCIHVSLDYQ